MSVDYKVRAIYEEEIHDVTKSADKWKTVLRSLSTKVCKFFISPCF